MPDYTGEPGEDITLEGPALGSVAAAPAPAEPFSIINVKLGKKPARRDSRDLMYASYRRPQHLAVAAEAHWGHGLPYDILGNGQYGDCVECTGQHALQVTWDRASTSTAAYVPTTDATLADYTAITGWNPADPSTDQGTDMRLACGYWRSAGVSGQYKTEAYLSVLPGNEVHAREAIQYYGGLALGLAMPVSAQAQTGMGVWAVTSGPDSVPGSWGGHAVWCSGFDTTGIWCITWGFLQKMTWDFYATYCDEAYVLLFPEWVRSTGYSPSGLLMGQLMTDLNSLA